MSGAEIKLKLGSSLSGANAQLLQEEAGEAKAGDDDQCALPPHPAPSSGGNKVAGEIQVRAEEEGGGFRLLPWGHG